jgi:hypothetical protein
VLSSIHSVCRISLNTQVVLRGRYHNYYSSLILVRKEEPEWAQQLAEHLGWDPSNLAPEPLPLTTCLHCFSVCYELNYIKFPFLAGQRLLIFKQVYPYYGLSQIDTLLKFKTFSLPFVLISWDSLYLIAFTYIISVFDLP